MWVAELWRYPVKSMAGEPLRTAEIQADGIRGDRVVQVRNDMSGRTVTSRNRPGLLGHQGRLDANGEPLVDGRPWRSAEVARDVVAAAGDGTRLVHFDGTERFDILPLLVATDGAIAAFGYDRRRLRPNIVVGGVPGLAERGWEGRVLRMGTVVIGVQDLRQRCIMTTFDPDTLDQDVEVLKHIHREFGGALALNCSVLRGGTLSVGDAVELLDHSPQ
ncbi:MAG: MOSC N-terminal beta barrel domain-containing protein [Deltaproteobacteria bacterium]|nr:MOSC N-terminal beta barrel domain-containing protein [Deltaproteobacteria bacterium]MBI3388152.1 MOSC N-terminal beta barrel domain-containing protein [Deltaproteobacteria bacterium]